MTCLRRFLLCLSLSATALASGAAVASGLQVSPVSVTIAATQNADGLWLSNTGDRPMHVQVRAYRWTQENDADRLEPTRELLVSPPMLELPAGERQLVRAIRTGAPPADGAQRAFRVIIDELPVPGNQAKGLQYVLRYSLPIFVEPAGAPASPPALQWALRQVGEQRLLEVTNSGGTHAQLADLAVIDRAGQRTVVAPGLLGYVLPGARMRWALKLPPSALAGGSWEAMINGNTEQGLPLAAPAR